MIIYRSSEKGKKEKKEKRRVDYVARKRKVSKVSDSPSSVLS